MPGDFFWQVFFFNKNSFLRNKGSHFWKKPVFRFTLHQKNKADSSCFRKVLASGAFILYKHMQP